MWSRLIAAATALSFASHAQAACEGDGLDALFDDAERAALTETAEATPYGSGLLWRATKGDADITIVGTMHLYDARHVALMERIDSEIDGAELLLVEMTSEEERAMNAAMDERPELFFITQGATLPDLLTEEMWAEVSAAARDRQIPSFLAAKQQPWLLGITLSMPTCAIADLVAGRPGLDHMIIERAEAGGVPVSSLEAWDTLPSVFSAMSMDDQLGMLQLALLEPELQETAFVGMLDSYFAEEIAEIWAAQELLIARLEPEDQAAATEGLALTEELLMTGRNLAWMPIILEAAETHDRIVVAAGAAHMPGEEGVLKLLEAQGWAISPLD